MSSNLFCRLKLMKLVSIRTRYGGARAVLCCRKSEDAICGLVERKYGSVCVAVSNCILKTYNLRTAFSLSSSSFFFCLSWFSFLHNTQEYGQLRLWNFSNRFESEQRTILRHSDSKYALLEQTSVSSLLYPVKRFSTRKYKLWIAELAIGRMLCSDCGRSVFRRETLPVLSHQPECFTGWFRLERTLRHS